ncbi:MAG: hypothetical protein JO219_00240 [Candidatus Eremiobacteraeota bacterium]|nr:hypothetical protein [Candidatus Eremiobacteraeota bacterium]MBV8365316.1 hypothetical protein [Candidatus Eremiobacteraeota bacterium]
MSLETWATLASIGTFIVIAATAIAALVQLRHMRAANQVTALQVWFTAYEGAELRSAFHFVRADLKERLEDPEFRRDISTAQIDRVKHPEITICNFFDQWGLQYRRGTIDRAAFMWTRAGVVLRFWKLLAEVIALRADPKYGNLDFQQFEYLAVQARDWLARHPAGDYPRGVPRMPLVETGKGIAQNTAAREDDR